MKGPKEDGHYAVLPDTMNVLSVTTSDRIAYVNFDKSFKDSALSSVAEQIPIYAVVDSITANCKVDKVQFSINGESDVTSVSYTHLKVFFTNSGTESIEGAIKVARKYAYLKDGSNDHEIIAMNHSFHGRSLGALSVTGNTHYQDPFKPLIGGIKFADFNDLESVKAQITDKTCAIIMETVQGEGGIYPATKEFLQGVRDLCDEHDILLILDEIQCGMGRTGKLFAWQDYGVQPDVMTCAKALGCGVPVGAFVLNKKTAEHSLVPGDHGTTYGGNPLACAAVNAVFECYEKQHVVEHVAETAPYLEKKLDELVEKYDCLAARRGKGFMQGLVVTGRPVGEVINLSLIHILQPSG